MSIELPVKVYVGLGSNCTDAEAVLGRARDGIAALPKLRLTAVSPVYSTEPQEFTDQPWFLNQVVELLPAPCWRPRSLLESLLRLETELGRVRSPDPAMRYGPRVIDADLLLYGEERRQSSLRGAASTAHAARLCSCAALGYCPADPH